MSIVLQSTGGGQITLLEPTTASNFTQTLPAATGTVMVSGNQPAFSVYKSANQSISTGVYTKITYDLEEFDTANCFASSRFTPNVAGYYQINANTYLQAAAGLTRVLPSVYKNGASYKFGNDNLTVSTTEGRGLASTLVFLNGTTDYVEIYVLVNATSPVIVNNIDNTWFNGVLVRAA